MRLTRVVAIAVVVLCGGAAARAQEPVSGAGSVRIAIIPRAGVVMPDAYLYEQYANFSGDGPVEWTNGSLGRALVLGVACEIGLEDRGFMLRGEVLRSFDAWLSAAHSVIVPRQLFEPPRVETTWLDAPTAITMMSVQIILPTRLTLLRTQPYVLAGAAGKRYDFGDPTTANEVEAILPASGTTWGADIGAGITLPLFGLSLDLQFRDAVNRYWGKTEHDFIATTGLRWRIR
jgi:hypothetical protein